MFIVRFRCVRIYLLNVQSLFLFYLISFFLFNNIGTPAYKRDKKNDILHAGTHTHKRNKKNHITPKIGSLSSPKNDISPKYGITPKIGSLSSPKNDISPKIGISPPKYGTSTTFGRSPPKYGISTSPKYGISTSPKYGSPTKIVSYSEIGGPTKHGISTKYGSPPPKYGTTSNNNVGFLPPQRNIKHKIFPKMRQNNFSSIWNKKVSPKVPVKDHVGHACGLGWKRWAASGKRARIGIGIAGNAGRLFGNCLGTRYGRYVAQNIHSSHRVQEESVVSNMHAAGTDLFTPSGGLLVPWGLLDPNSRSVKTYQGINYKIGSDPKFKYNHAVSIQGRGLYQRKGHDWDHDKPFPAHFVFTAGPNNADCTRKGPKSSMLRTYDKSASDWDYFCHGIIYALVAMFDKMIHHGVNIAIVPGLSTGLYAGTHKHRINRVGTFSNLINLALTWGGVDRSAKFSEIWYAHY